MHTWRSLVVDHQVELVYFTCLQNMNQVTDHPMIKSQDAYLLLSIS
jgi:hypothetical protein